MCCLFIINILCVRYKDKNKNHNHSHHSRKSQTKIYERFLKITKYRGKQHSEPMKKYFETNLEEALYQALFITFVEKNMYVILIYCIFNFTYIEMFAIS